MGLPCRQQALCDDLAVASIQVKGSLPHCAHAALVHFVEELEARPFDHYLGHQRHLGGLARLLCTPLPLSLRLGHGAAPLLRGLLCDGGSLCGRIGGVLGVLLRCTRVLWLPLLLLAHIGAPAYEDAA